MSVKSYANTCTEQLTKHFNAKEFKCKCTSAHDIKIDSNLLNMLEKLYSTLHCTKIIITSGYRCPNHDKAVGGNGSGQHTKGTASDIICYNAKGIINSKIVCCIAADLGFGGVANINKSYQAVHVDVRTGNKYFGDEIRGTNSIWNYNKSWTNFYTYWGLNKTNVYKQAGIPLGTPTTSTTPSSTSNNKITFTYTNKYDSDIKELQNILNNKGAKISADGIAGPETYEAVKKYTIRMGDKGPLTLWVQKRLTHKGYKPGNPDGIAGNNTMNAIKSFQKDNGLGQGYLGGTDWYYLIK